MQDRYTGDIGDYIKLSMLRALSPGRRLAVAWWKHPNGGPLGDGRHISYLEQPELWRHFDAEVFDVLRKIVSSSKRNVCALEEADLIHNVTWFSELVPTEPPWQDRAARRVAWFDRLRATCEQCDLVFVDPDNGLEPGSFRPSTRQAAKSVSLAELQALSRPGRTLIVYHHQTRNNGTHIEEIGRWAARLRLAGFGSVDALRASPGSARAFFLLEADENMRRRASTLSALWRRALTWHPEPRTAMSSKSP